MAAELVVDASVAVKWFITEDGSEIARALIGSGSTFVAPDLILLELASVAAKRVRRRDIPDRLGRLIVSDGRQMFDQIVAAAPLAEEAYSIASTSGVSPYDAVYLALARQRRSTMITADAKLVARAGEADLGDLVLQM